MIFVSGSPKAFGASKFFPISKRDRKCSAKYLKEEKVSISRIIEIRVDTYMGMGQYPVLSRGPAPPLLQTLVAPALFQNPCRAGLLGAPSIILTEMFYLLKA